SDRYWIDSIQVHPLNTSNPDQKLDLTYTYDNVGNVSQIADGRSGYTQNFSYDVLDRIAEATGYYGSSTFTYDAHGNRIDPGFSYDPVKRFWLRNYNGVTIDYDDNGNVKSASQATYDYSSRNLLKQTTVGSSVTHYEYDADDWRVKKETEGGVTSYF